MKLKEGTRIEIKRLTKEGIKKSIGTYLECAGIQYCIVKDSSYKSYYLIHLDSGLSCASVDFESIKEKDVFSIFKQKASEIDLSELKEKVKIKIVELKKQGYKFPVNE